jgi:hypothetical protein
MNVLEAVGVTERISKGACAWHGATRVHAVLARLLEDGKGTDAAAAGAASLTAAAKGGAVPASPDAGSGDASSLKALATKLMQTVGSVPGAQPIPFDACVAALKLGGVPAADAPGANGTGALAGAARRLHDVASILIRVGVLGVGDAAAAGGGKGRGELKWLGAVSMVGQCRLTLSYPC